MALLTVILEVHDRAHGQATGGPDIERRDWYAIYLDQGEAMWRFRSVSWVRELWP